MENPITVWDFYNTKADSTFQSFMEELGVTVGPNEPVSPSANIKVDSTKFVEYIKLNKDTCQQKWFHPRDFLSKSTNFEMSLPMSVGRSEGNTTEYNWGLYENTNSEIKDLIGYDNLLAAGFLPDTVLVRLLVYLPGHGIPWHRDTLDGWSEKFKQLNPDVKSGICDLGPIKRSLIMLEDWHWGHMVQLGNSIISHWGAGDVFDIPLGKWHLSTNSGIVPKLSISASGVVA